MREYEIIITPDEKVPGASFIHVVGDFWPYTGQLFLGCESEWKHFGSEEDDLRIVTVCASGLHFPQFYVAAHDLIDSLQNIARLADLESMKQYQAAMHEGYREAQASLDSDVKEIKSDVDGIVLDTQCKYCLRPWDDGDSHLHGGQPNPDSVWADNEA